MKKDYKDEKVRSEIRNALDEDGLDFIQMDREFFINLLPYLKTPAKILIHQAFRVDIKEDVGMSKSFDIDKFVELYGPHVGSVTRSLAELRETGLFEFNKFGGIKGRLPDVIRTRETVKMAREKEKERGFYKELHRIINQMRVDAEKKNDEPPRLPEIYQTYASFCEIRRNRERNTWTPDEQYDPAQLIQKLIKFAPRKPLVTYRIYESLAYV